MKIRKSEITAALTKLIQLIDSNTVDEIDLPDDYYWAVLGDDVYNPYKSSAELEVGLGQLTDDWQSLTKKLSSASEVSSDEFFALAAILHAIGHNWIDSYISSLDRRID